MSSFRPEEHRPRILQIAFVVLVLSLIYSILFLGGFLAWVSIVADITVIAVTLWLLYRIAVGVERIASASERIATAREQRSRDELGRERRSE